ncbi:hypothetical protein niasHS_017725 [Heterodera schachtii]|uniref:Granulins domain-containing protein n=1 Tax=Heterodera schachtii TaxID=97005 RepID=A0ABD2I111_HETSC
MPKSLSPLFLLLLSFAFGATGELPAERVNCPDGRSFCPEKTTCCQLSDEGHYGCCPLPKAICCMDHLHCCPEDTQCDLPQQKCVNSDGNSQPFHRKMPAKTQNGETVEQKGTDEEATEEVICPDGSSKCPPHATCCPLGDGFGPKRKKRTHWHPFFIRFRYPTAAARLNGPFVARTTSTAVPTGRNATRRAASAKARKCTESAQETAPPARICGDSVGPLSAAHRQRISICERNEKCCRHRDGENRKKIGCCPFEDGQCCAHSAHCCPAGFA